MVDRTRTAMRARKTKSDQQPRELLLRAAAATHWCAAPRVSMQLILSDGRQWLFVGAFDGGTNSLLFWPIWHIYCRLVSGAPWPDATSNKRLFWPGSAMISNAWKKKHETKKSAARISCNNWSVCEWAHDRLVRPNDDEIKLFISSDWMIYSDEMENDGGDWQ